MKQYDMATFDKKSNEAYLRMVVIFKTKDGSVDMTRFLVPMRTDEVLESYEKEIMLYEG